MAKVVVGISGGVDSSVAAYLLKEQGHEVVGLFMQNWHDTTGVIEGDCPWKDDLVLAQLVAKNLGIEFHHRDFSEMYHKKVVEYLFNEYEKGRTPNPDVLCNREIKFDVFLEAARDLGAEYIATGHYCRKSETETPDGIKYNLLAGLDNNKDQSYFLCQLNQEQLAPALFPIGELDKPEVREIAEKIDMPTATRKDSQGICFIGKVDLPVFLQQKLSAKDGEIVEIPENSPIYSEQTGRSDLPEQCKAYNYNPEDGTVVGKHRGAHFYTIGQRKGLNVGGKAKPLFVIAINVEQNVVYVGQGHDHPGLNRSGLRVDANEIHWVRPDLKMKAGEKRDYLVRIRYRQPLQKATLHQEENAMYITFEEPQRGIAAGQFAAWYDNDNLLGSGVISE